MKKTTALVFFMAVVMVSCKWDSDVIVSFKGGGVTRGEFIQWLKDRGLTGEESTKKRDMMIGELQMLAINSIALREAKRVNHEKSERFSFLISDISDRYLASFLMEKILKEKGYKEKALKIRQILMPVESASDAGAAISKAREAIAELDRGASFRDMVSKYSMHPSRNQGGDIGYLVRVQMPPAYANAAFALKKGEYTKEPLHLTDLKSVCIILVEDEKEITPKTIEKIVRDDGQRAHLGDILNARLKSEYVHGLMQESGAVFNEQAVRSKAPGTVIFSIGDIKFTAGDLSARMLRMRQIMNEGPGAGDTASRESIAREYFSDRLLVMDAKKKGLDRDPEYLKRVKEARESYLAGDYIEYASSGNIEVTPAEVRKEYELFKDGRYSSMVTVNGKKERRVMPFAEVSEEIERGLRMQKRLMGRDAWMKRMMEEYDVRIADEMLGKKG
ncbi:MAG TPA: peptidylprolyl isomerase [Spirochaetota bacterium]|nr:peptidylprolyl isomerase [Spirochaetota bacterium]